MSLKKLLQNSFNINLPISGGFGKSPQDAIVLDENGPTDYVGTEHTVLKYIETLKNEKWHKVKQSQLIHNKKHIDKIEIEALVATKEETITERRAYYFDVEYFFQQRTSIGNFNKERTLDEILERLIEMREEDENNKKYINLLKSGKLLSDYDHLSKFMEILQEDQSFRLFEDMSKRGKQSIISVLREIAPRL